jgi:glycosyltransferase involved in cell wall biosynthesis
MGEGQQRPELERLIQVEGVSESVNLLGHVSDASSYLKALDLFVLPSRSEGLGYVLLEAGSAGLPVVATNVGGIPEIVEHEETGLLVPSGDREALTNALERLANDEALRTQLGKNLQEKVARDFSFPRMLTETLAFYEKNS